MKSPTKTLSLRTWIEIDQAAFKHNIQQLLNFTRGKTKMGIVVKANAYGHGMLEIAQLCEKEAAISWLFTVSIEEALQLRTAGISKPILALAYHDGDLEQAIKQDIDITVWDTGICARLEQAAQRAGKNARIHLKIDTGMSRLGLFPHEVPNFVKQIKNLKHIELFGIFTHLSDTNNSDLSFTHQQLEYFDKLIAELKEAGCTIPFTHALSSGGLLLPHHYSCVRIGTNAYGFWKSALQQQRFSYALPGITLRPVLRWKTRIIQIKDIKVGDAVGYNRAFIAPHAMRIAILPVGYFDGYARALSGKGIVAVQGKEAPVLGIVSMNLTAIDITGHEHCVIGDEVELISMTPGTSATDIASLLQTINNEVTTRIHPDIPRIVV